MFGGGFVTLADLLDRIPGDVFEGWATYVAEYDRLEEHRKDQAEHDDVMAAATKATRGSARPR